MSFFAGLEGETTESGTNAVVPHSPFGYKALPMDYLEKNSGTSESMGSHLSSGCESTAEGEKEPQRTGTAHDSRTV